MPVNPRKESCSFCKAPLGEVKVNNRSYLELVCDDINCPRVRQPQGIRKIYFGRANVKEGNDVTN